MAGFWPKSELFTSGHFQDEEKEVELFLGSGCIKHILKREDCKFTHSSTGYEGQSGSPIYHEEDRLILYGVHHGKKNIPNKTFQIIHNVINKDDPDQPFTIKNGCIANFLGTYFRDRKNKNDPFNIWGEIKWKENLKKKLIVFVIVVVAIEGVFVLIGKKSWILIYLSNKFIRKN